MKTGTCENCGKEDVELNRIDNEYGVRGVNFCVCDECLSSLQSSFEEEENDRIREIILESGEGPWKLIRTRFHGGGIILETDDIDEMIRAYRRDHDTDCTCGCSMVFPVGTELVGTETNDRNGYSPYAFTE